MSKPAISKLTAEKQFAAIQNKHKSTLSEMDAARQEKAENIARQRAQRLAKEAAEKKKGGDDSCRNTKKQIKITRFGSLTILGSLSTTPNPEQ